MKVLQIEQEIKMNMVIDRLHQLGFYQTDGLNYRELKRKLVIEDARQTVIGSPHSSWF